MTTLDTVATYGETVQAWRAEQEDELRAEDGWLTVVGLFWLHDGINTVGSSLESAVVLPSRLPLHLGILTLEDGDVHWRVTTGKYPVSVDGESRQEAVLLSSATQPTLVQFERITFFVIRRGDRLAVRLRDADSEARRTFTGRRWFAVDPAYRLTGQFQRHPSKRPIEVDTVIGTTVRFTSPGTVTFELDGAQHTLIAFDGDTEHELWFVFRDATSGRSTYGSGRFLNAPLAADGTVELDFNRAKSPPCAFTPYATCPLPPRENTLSIPIPAGEQAAH